MVFYRTYRPKLIAELDKTDIREKLSMLARASSRPHAFLLSGSRGTGKTSTARILARIINCNKLVNGEPCNSCENCTAILRGNHLDVLEIDAASNRGIDEIRALRETIALAPSMARKKIYIIDEVHMLTREAFNALLKTLEEPPSHVTFILATTEPHKLPGTILSRCTIFTFSKATSDELVRSLTRVVTGEKIAISDHALKRIAQAADGSFRDAVKLLEQASVEKKLADQDIEMLVGLSGTSKLIELVLKKEMKKALAHIEDKDREGVNFLLYTQSLLEELHGRLIENPTSIETKRLTQYMVRAYHEGRTTAIPPLPLELAVIEYCHSS